VTDRATGRRANGIWTSGYRNGRQHYVVAGKDWQLANREAAAVGIELPMVGHVYEMRTGPYLGRTRRLATELQVARAKVLAVLPYEVQGLTAEPEDRMDRGQDLELDVRIRANGQIGQDDIHLVRVRAYAPDGTEATSLRRFEILRRGVGKIRLPIAYDDPAGEWTVRLQDQATRKSADIRFPLR